MKKRLLISFLFIHTFTFCQVKISDSYLGIGYHFTKMDNFDNFYNELIGADIGFPLDSFPEFDELKGFTNIGLGTCLSFTEIPKLQLNISIDYLFHKKEQAEYTTFKTYNGFSPDIENDMETYEYSYQLNNLILGFTPEYRILTHERINISAGIGILGIYSSLKQSGIELSANTSEWVTNAKSENYSKFSLGWQAGLTFGLKITDKSNIDFSTKYKAWKIKDFGPTSVKETGIPNNSKTTFYPITKTTIDLSGLTLQLRYSYSF